MSSDEEYDPQEGLEKIPDVPPVTASAPEERPSVAAEVPVPLPAPVPRHETADRKHARMEEEEGGLRLRGPIKGRVRDVCLTPSGTVLCAVSEDGQLCMWDFHTPMESRRPQPTRTLTPFVNRIAGLQPIVAVHASNDSSYFVACQDGDSPVLVGAGGKQLGYCAAGERGLLDVVQCKGHRAPVTSSSPDPTDAKHFYTASQDGTARQWSEALFERKSLYVVKHGTGQLTDTVTVESVLGLSPKVGDGLFCTAGSDGLVQVWDCRVKYRPGGCAASWDVHALSFGKDATPATTGTKSRRKTVDPFEAAKHTGGMAEVTGSVATLAVRVGDVVKMLDLRKPFSKGGSLVCEPLRGLPPCGDTTPVRPCRDPSHFVTCTTREGYNHVVGGHVVQFGGVEGGYQCVSTWRSGRPDEDALSVCCGSAGEMFCGLSSGVVVVQPDATQSAPVCQWLGTRPSNESGEKRHRLEVDEEETIF